MLLHKDLQLHFQGPSNDPLGAIANHFAEDVPKGWIRKRNRRIVVHGGASPLSLK